MTLLRSRKFLSPVTPKPSQPLTPEKVVVEPVTPSKTSELNPSSNTTSPSSSSPIQNRGHFEIGFGSGEGSIMVFECGIARRLSARLAKKVCVNDNVEVVSAKMKEVEGASINVESDVRNLRRRVSNLKMGVAGPDGIPDDQTIFQPILQDLGVGGVAELVEEKEKVKIGESVAKETCMVETVIHGRRKRRFSMEVKELGLESCAEDRVEKEFLSLRSGKRVVKKREMRDGIIGDGNFYEGVVNRNDGGVVFSSEVFSEDMSEAKAEEDENGHWKEELKFIEGEESKGKGKGKGKVDSETSVINGPAPVNFKLHGRKLSLSDLNQDAVNYTRPANLKEEVKDECGIAIETGVKTRRRLSIEEKRKIKSKVGPSSSSAVDTAELEVENINESSASGAEHSANNVASAYRERFRRIARRNASRFAHFSSHDELGSHAHDVVGREIPSPESDIAIEDWPGPFSTAMKIIKDREGKRNGERHSASTNKSDAVELKWIPRNQESCKHQNQAPSLIELCLSILSKNVDAITSLDFVPDALRHKICYYLCDSRRMDGHFLELLVQGNPTEIRIRDCSWLSDQLFIKTFEGCKTSKLAVLQFDQCGSCMSDYALHTALARSPNSLPALTSISLQGAYRLSDAGLRQLVSYAPSLKSIDISQCPLLTSEGICFLANSLGLILRELYLNNCHGIDAMLILPALQNLEKLEVLSVAGIPTVCDDFVSNFVSGNGCRMKELVLADCMELTDSSLKVIGDTCPDLRAIDLTNLHKLTDISVGYLANGCRAIQTIKFCRNIFSDEAIAAYIDVRGASLKDLALNNITQVSNHTALSLARNCRNLRSLDVSWCRNLTNEALGMIVDSCTYLEVVKLFGCSQVTNVFVDGHSNLQVKLVGLKMSSVLKNINVPDFLLGPLRYS